MKNKRLALIIALGTAATLVTSVAALQAFAGAGASVSAPREDYAPASSASGFRIGDPNVLSEMNKLAEAGPGTIRCAGAVPAICRPVPDSEVITALERGDLNLYGRTVHEIVPGKTVELHVPLFERAELLCGEQRSDGEMICRPAASFQPTIQRGEAFIVSYKPLRVSVASDGRLIGRQAGRLSVPLVYASH